MKRHLITIGVVLVLASLYPMWHENCITGCHGDVFVLGWPVFLRTPLVPGSSRHPEFFFAPLLINILWSLVVAVSFWAVVETMERWQDRQRGPPKV